MNQEEYDYITKNVHPHTSSKRTPWKRIISSKGFALLIDIFI
jgi:hypothetical protein